jgi:hypothetical protein
VTDRDDLLHRVMAANPHPKEQALPASFAELRPPLALLIRKGTAMDTPTEPQPAIPEPHLLPLAVDEDELLTIERSRTMDTQQRPEVQATQRPGRWRTAAIVLTTLIMVGAVAGVALLIAGNGNDLVTVADAVPTLTFDGETATYSGPSTFDQNLLTFRLVNNSDSVRASFGWNVMNDETITLEQDIAWMETHRGDNYSIPKWVEAWGLIDFTLPPNTVIEESVSVSIPDGKCALYVWDARNQILYPAAHITVNSG